MALLHHGPAYLSFCKERRRHFEALHQKPSHQKSEEARTTRGHRISYETDDAKLIKSHMHQPLMSHRIRRRALFSVAVRPVAGETIRSDWHQDASWHESCRCGVCLAACSITTMHLQNLLRGCTEGAELRSESTAFDLDSPQH